MTLSADNILTILSLITTFIGLIFGTIAAYRLLRHDNHTEVTFDIALVGIIFVAAGWVIMAILRME